MGIVDLEGRVAVITGATGGLGRVVARTFAEAGANLALLSTDQAKLDVLVGELHLPAGRVLAFAADLRDPEAAQAAARVVSERFGHSHILLHLVGGWVGGHALTEMEPRDLQAMLGQHVWSTFAAIQAFVPQLQASGWGRVIVVSSPAATRPRAKAGAYAAAKAAEEALMLTLAEEVGPHGVTANIVQVSAIDIEHQREQAPSPANRHWTTPEEIASAILYLCLEAGGAVNGARLTLTRGAV
jgi:NAD(P)-dependent dehydrogenase (short-subunit alcohol dehydrogenase family)